MSEQLYYDNTVTQWLTALLFIIASFVIGRIVYWIFNKGLMSLAKNTETKLDDIIVDMMEEPFAFAVILAGVRYSFTTLTLPASIANWPEASFQFLLTLTIAWFFVRLYDALYQEFFVPLAQNSKTDFYTQTLPIVSTGLKFIVWLLAIGIGFHNGNYEVGAILISLMISGILFLLIGRRTLTDTMHGAKAFVKNTVAIQSETSLTHKWVYNSILLLCFISLLLTLFLCYRYYQDKTERETKAFAKSEQDAEMVAKHVNDELTSLMNMIDAVANDLTSGELSNETLTPRLRTEMENYPHIFGLGVSYEPYAYKADLRLYSPYYAKDENDKFQRFQIEDSYDYTDRANDNANWYTVPVDEQKAQWVQPYYGQVAQAWLTEYVAPFYQNEKLSGVVFVDHSLDTLDELVKTLDLGEEGYAFIISKNGTYAVHPDKTYVGQTIFDVAEQLDDTRLKSDGKKTLTGKRFFREGIDPTTGREAWMFYEPIPFAGWTIGVILDKEIRVVTPNSTKRNLTWIALATIAFLFFSSILLFRADRATTQSLWGVSISTAILFTCGIGFFWYLEIDIPTRDSGQVVLVNKTSLQEQLTQVNETFEKAKLSPPIPIPTGIMLETITFGNANENVVSGYIWQKYPLDLPEGITKEPMFTDVLDEEGALLNEIYRFQKGKFEVIGWFFRANLRQEPSVSKYPLDEATVQIQIWPSLFGSDHNLILVPDLEAYDLINPTKTPGIVEALVLEGWHLERSYFSFRSEKYNANFGGSTIGQKRTIPDLYYNVVIRRSVLSPIIAHATAIPALGFF